MYNALVLLKPVATSQQCVVPEAVVRQGGVISCTAIAPTESSLLHCCVYMCVTQQPCSTEAAAGEAAADTW
jgi:hypothetical protein